MPAALDIDAIRAWCDNDPDNQTRSELEALLAALPETEAELRDRFAQRLGFGTAGLRGLLGAGLQRMNRAVVRQTTAGLADYLLEQGPGVREQGVVIGYDGRHLSREMAHDCAGVLAAREIRVFLVDRTAPTPLIAFAVRHLHAAAGVVVTASHNPPQYNGFKVYWSNGAQIVPPHDQGISAAIDADLLRHGPPLTGAAKAVPLLSTEDARAAGLLQEPGAELEAAYLQALATALPVRTRQADPLRIVYTPLHGVGKALALAALAQAGFQHVHVVAAQAEPDGDFPTLVFPNPEEPGALDLALDLAAEVGADLVLANDPDADRLAVVSRAGDGSLIALGGNQIGALLGDFLLHLAAPGESRKLVITSIVSSGLLAEIATAHGAECDTVLTGFKWICNRAMERESEGLEFVFGFEEALGYTVGRVCRDKDGIGAAVAFAELAAQARDAGLDVPACLDALHRKHGFHRTHQESIVYDGPSGQQRIAAIMATLREAPPEHLGGRRVLALTDLQNRTRLDCTTGERVEVQLPAANLLRFDLSGEAWVVARPSGTEPKIKFYFEVRERVDEHPLSLVRRATQLSIDKLVLSLRERIAALTVDG